MSGFLSFKQIHSLPALLLASGITFLIQDAIPIFFPTLPFSYTVVAILEAVLVFQLILAWNQQEQDFSYAHIYLFAILFCFRVLYFSSLEGTNFWGMRAADVHSPGFGFLWYAIGIVFLHPVIFAFLHQITTKISSWELWKRRGLFVGWMIVLAICFYVFSSRHITRDGGDWILRTTKPIWHLYMREPLTIGLYRWIYLALNSFTRVNSYQVISMLSILGGIWSLFWLHRLFQRQSQDVFVCFIGWLLVLSSSGMILLFFGHVEVYPVFVAGLLPVFCLAKEYLLERRSVVPVSIFFSIAFLLHLSAGWLMPAFLLLPFLQKSLGKAFRDCVIFWGVFLAIQICWWGGLLLFCYNADLTKMLARLHETFFVGPDRAMFLPAWAWFDSFHLWDLFNEYLYLSLSGCMLMPIAIYQFVKMRHRHDVFWFVLFAGYFLYTFFWNPDRGYPEDWDLFTPLVPLVVLFQFHVLTDSEASLSSNHLHYLYISACGTIPFVLGQVWFHHVVPFVHF